MFCQTIVCQINNVNVNKHHKKAHTPRDDMCFLKPTAAIHQVIYKEVQNVEMVQSSPSLRKVLSGIDLFRSKEKYILSSLHMCLRTYIIYEEFCYIRGIIRKLHIHIKEQVHTNSYKISVEIPGPRNTV